MPPAIRILVLEAELSERQDGVLERLGAEWGAFEIAIFDINMVIKLGINLAGNHGEEKDILVVDSRVLNFEPELDAILLRPVGEGRSSKADETLSGVQTAGDVAVVTGDAIEDLDGIIEGASDSASLSRDFKEDIFESLGTRKIEFLAERAAVIEAR